MHRALTVANHIIEYSDNNQNWISNLKLQKVLYLVQAHYMITKKEPCFEDEIQAMDFGPYIEEVYKTYAGYGGLSIFKHSIVDGSFFGCKYVISEEDQAIIESVVDLVKDYSASTLLDVIHGQNPWRNAYRKGINITNESLYRYFRHKG